MRWSWPGCLLLLSLAVLVYASGCSLQSVAALALLFMPVWLSGIGVARVFMSASGRPLATVVFGALIGVTLLRVLVLILALLVDSPTWRAALALGILVTLGLLTWWSHRHHGPRWNLEERQDVQRLLLLLAACTVLVTPAYFSFARPTPRGYVLAPYFDHDFLSHAGVVAELTRALPPENPNFARERLHYYWFHHVWPSVVACLGRVSAIDALMVSNVLGMLIFVATLFVLVQRYIANPGPCIAAIALVVFAPSYLGLAFAARAVFPSVVEPMLPAYFTAKHSLLSHSWFRDFLFEPHAITALSLLCLVAYVTHAQDEQFSRLRAGANGLLLSLALASDGFLGIIGSVWYAGLVSVRVLRRRWPQSAVVIPGAVWGSCLLLFTALGLLPLGERLIDFGMHPIISVAPLYLLVEMGPLFLGGLLGLAVFWRYCALDGLGDFVILGVIALLTAFVIYVPGHENFVLRKGLKILQFPFVLLTALGFKSVMWATLGGKMKGFVCGLAALGFVSVVTDTYQYLRPGVHGAQEATYLSVMEMHGLNWLRTRTEPDAIVQAVDVVRPHLRHNDIFDFRLVSFGERRTLFGNYHTPYITHVPRPHLEARVAALERMFEAQDGATMLAVLAKLRPTYLWVDMREPVPLLAIDELMASGQLRQEFAEGPIRVLRVMVGDAGAARVRVTSN